MDLNLLEQKQRELSELEAAMNAKFAEIADLEKERSEELVQEQEEYLEEEEEIENAVEESGYEAAMFLGEKPEQTEEKLSLSKDILDYIRYWIKKGLSKDEKEKLLSSIPREGEDISLEAPELNAEMAADLLPRQLNKDEVFREYQNLTGSTLALTASVLNMLLTDKEPNKDFVLGSLSDAVKLQAELFYCLSKSRRICLITGRYEEKVRRMLRQTTPSKFLFGDNLKLAIENSKTMEKVVKDLKAKQPKPAVASTNQQGPSSSFFWRSSSVRRDNGRGSRYQQHQRYTPGYSNSARYQTSRSSKNPGKGYYGQSQPQRYRR